MAAYERGLDYYPSPRFAARLAYAYYKAAMRSKSPLYKMYYLEVAQQTAEQYLTQYPKDKELSILYLRTQRYLH